MRLIEQIDPLRAALAQGRKCDGRIGFVPTMGNLHQGHLELVRRAKEVADQVVVSIYVNPVQFGAGEDFDAYPRTLERDRDLLAETGACDLLFVPSDRMMYGDKERDGLSHVVVPGISDMLCGLSRPGHFTGVATVVTKLFNIVQPHVAFFGEKDYQQLLVIRRLVSELNFPVDIVGVPIVRESDGLAMSSRNGYLSDEERGVASKIYTLLQSISRQLQQGRRDYANIEEEGVRQLSVDGFEPEYLAIRRSDLEAADEHDSKLVVLAAARLGTTRLIDNCQVDLR